MGGCIPRVVRRSSAAKKAARVFPEPVGAMTKVDAPVRMASHAPSWALVGASKARRNHARAGGDIAANADSILPMNPSCSRPPTVSRVPWQDGPVRLTEFWARMATALGPEYAEYWADSFVVAELQGRTVRQALAAGVDTGVVWRAVYTTLELPPTMR